MENNGFIHDGDSITTANGKPEADSASYKRANSQKFTDGRKQSQEFDDVGKNTRIELADEDDPWQVTRINVSYTPWNELSRRDKQLRVVAYTLKIILVLGCLYIFICSLDFLSSAFRLLGGETAGKVFQRSDILKNPVAGVMIGVLVTVLVQSSSTSTSVVVSMVGAGILNIKTAIPIVMGANIGTSVTNTIVAMGQIGNRDEFRRAFAGGTVHDMFNWLTVLVLLPVEVITGYLYHLTEAIVNSLPLQQDKTANKEMLNVITKPFTERIIQISKDAIAKIAHGMGNQFDNDQTILKLCCDEVSPSQCCRTRRNNLDFIQSGQNYTLLQKQAVCKEVAQCLGKKKPQPSPYCESIPWIYGEQQTRITTEVIDCAIFKGTNNETKCCQSKLDGLSSEASHIEKCQMLSSCFQSDDHIFTKVDCKASWFNVTEERKVWGQRFSCTRWTRDVENYTCHTECNYLLKGLYPTLNEKAIGGILLVISLTILCICLVCIVKLLHSLLQGPVALIIKKFINADLPGCCGYFTGYVTILIGAGLTIIVQSSSVFTSTLTPLVGIGVIQLDRMYPLTLGSNIGTTTTAILSAMATSSDSIRNALQIAFCHLFFNISGIILFYPIPALRFPLPLARFLGNSTANYRWFAIVYILAMFFIFPALVFALSIPGWYVLLAVLGPFALLIFVVCVIKLIQIKRPNLLPEKLHNWAFLPLAFRSLEPYDKIMQKVFFCKKFQNPKEGEKGPMDSNSSEKRYGSQAINKQTTITRL
ncbi:unnamed protein product [Candidula unifasciata]|uniref:Sodium-dependent phosphate transport protein 2B n=1 Tax=Candidula unifasciata TaxID=100452 RepID=A0A8S4A4Q3_9EUPU|nr:unnamed protein product [Candidula unifasciata]